MYLWRIKPKDKVNSISLHELELEGVILFPRDEEYNSRERRNEGESVFGEGSYEVEEERNEKKAFKKSFRLFSRDMQERQKNNTIKCHL